MKNIATVFLIIILALGAVLVVDMVYADEPATKVIAYYFHGNFRCPTCYKLQQYSKEAIETNFKDDLASGKLIFKIVNTDEKGNEHFVDDYKLYTKSLILSLVKDGKEIRSKNLDKIWEYARDKKRFMDYVTKETRLFMEEAR